MTKLGFRGLFGFRGKAGFGAQDLGVRSYSLTVAGTCLHDTLSNFACVRPRLRMSLQHWVKTDSKHNCLIESLSPKPEALNPVSPCKS